MVDPDCSLPGLVAGGGAGHSSLGAGDWVHKWLVSKPKFLQPERVLGPVPRRRARPAVTVPALPDFQLNGHDDQDPVPALHHQLPRRHFPKIFVALYSGFLWRDIAQREA
ncbi:hypothetical protein KFL_003660170 [Klebsormidium nitens]|uniref:Uncharacterized protein n=1 Tax=Klebsormidium nitens TaxID=105231 RepID=A0A1Y1I9I8_KLENI|nr:hypothetical protein KFL_003660170 [Klebsormidium nitens]|eukprot:GAQ87635.1 hypothetical protein KFL_003660170 [Klebsormidium nitens]